MKAVRIHAWGDASRLQFDEVPIPDCGADEVLIRTVAASVNPVDWKIREGYLKDALPLQLPLTLGWDVSGVVDRVGSAVTDFKPGDAVYSRPDITRNGTYAEYVVVRAAEIAVKPATISHVEAASLPLSGITAWESLIEVGALQPAQRVLIHAAAGGVGSLAVQLARWRGAHVIATCSAANRELVLSLGADEVIDYREQDFRELARDMDLVFDTLGGEVQERSWSVLKPGGLLVSVVQPPSQSRAEELGLRAAFVFIQPSARILRELARLVEAGRLRPIVGAEFALEDVARAQALSQSGRARGKIVLYVGKP